MATNLPGWTLAVGLDLTGIAVCNCFAAAFLARFFALGDCTGNGSTSTSGNDSLVGIGS
jgi:hypothetical protein